MRKNDSKEVVKNLNAIRNVNCNRNFSKKELIELVKGVIPGLSTYFTTAVKYGLVCKRDDLYSLPSEPIYVGRVEEYLKDYRHAAAIQSKARRVPIPENNQPESKNDDVDTAINLLKQTGDYKVYKKVINITWEEV